MTSSPMEHARVACGTAGDGIMLLHMCPSQVAVLPLTQDGQDVVCHRCCTTMMVYHRRGHQMSDRRRTRYLIERSSSRHSRLLDAAMSHLSHFVVEGGHPCHNPEP
eukprot:Tamp_16131.p2 GENE.Tamp_16131~~Tamp_16131.p2  ORF type:complete len:106 (-),score=4.58 Tamp_16131:728-1045(-)